MFGGDIARFSYYTDDGQEITITSSIPNGDNTFNFTVSGDTNTFYLRIGNLASLEGFTITIVSIEKEKEYNGYKLSPDLKWDGSKLIVDGNIKLLSGNTHDEGEIKYVNKNLWLNTGGTINDWIKVGSEDQFSTPSNVVLVDPSQPEVAGYRYQTWANADSYVQSQSPSETNRWTIKITSTNNENITVSPFVVIEGEKGNTFLTGNVSSDTAFSIEASANYTSVIRQCFVTNLNLQAGSYIAFYDCDLSGTTASTGAFVQLFQSSVIAGDYSQYSFFQTFDGLINGGIFSDTIDARATEFFDNFQLNGGRFENCYFRDRPNSVYNSGNYTLINTIITRGWNTNPGDVIDMYNCTLLDGTTWGTGATFNTRSIIGELNLTDNSNWNNSGITYNNSDSGLLATDTQKAIDELSNNTKVSIINSDIVLDYTNGTGYTNKMAIDLPGDNSYYKLKSLLFYTVSDNDDYLYVGAKIRVHRDYLSDSSIKYISPVRGSYNFYEWEHEHTFDDDPNMTFIVDGIIHTGNISGTTSVQFSILDDTVTGSTLTVYNNSYMMLTKL